MVHLRCVTLWLGLIAIAEGLFAIGLATLFGDQAGLDGMGSEAAGLAGTLIPAGIVALVLWVGMSILTAQKRAAAEAAMNSASRAS
ncbi:hypothetical protein [Naasia aerilata]|uniref:Uncharacterized protein n=1 Tax=Naasia aerilata TaxID=1162966 RepID=A0ABM8GCH7_9MICO|nr:hypothetical protein [Naasia aerilata]BDZ45958.1 hypothetical protein GCM10025866_18670 [Naasia aerilata]